MMSTETARPLRRNWSSSSARTSTRVGLGADRESGLGLPLHCLPREGVDRGLRLHQRILGPVQLELRLTDLHPGVLGRGRGSRAPGRAPRGGQSMSRRISTAPLPPLSPAPWQADADGVVAEPEQLVAASWIPWFSWQVAQPGAPIWRRRPWRGRSWRTARPSRYGTAPQTFPTQDMPGGAAPWLPWQSLQVGADRSPFVVIVFQWTLALVLRELIGGDLVGRP